VTPRAVDRPSPVPLPREVLVKKGAKTRCWISGGTPWPVSSTSSLTKLPGAGFGGQAGVVRGKVFIRCVQAEVTAAGHGVAGVDAAIEYHPVELGGVGEVGAEGVRALEMRVDLAGEGLAHQGPDFPQEVAERHRQALTLDAAAEGQELADDIRPRIAFR